MGSSASEILAELEAEVRTGSTRREIKADSKLIAQAARDYARSISPVLKDPAAHPSEEPGTFRDSIEVEETDDGFAVVSNDPAARYIEYGTSRTPEFGVFAKTAERFSAANELSELT